MLLCPVTVNRQTNGYEQLTFRTKVNEAELRALLNYNGGRHHSWQYYWKQVTVTDSVLSSDQVVFASAGKTGLHAVLK